ncbi:MAG: hypothetical protein L3K09_07280 [Thermoplasmata archaeon]|nr:hypothetical protein [Thermoplasmata archaeon]
MPAKRKSRVSLHEGKKTTRRVRANLATPTTAGRKRLLRSAGQRTAVRTVASSVKRRVASARKK